MPDIVARKKTEAELLKRLLEELLNYRKKVEASEDVNEQISALNSLNNFLEKSANNDATYIEFSVHEKKWLAAKTEAIKGAQISAANAIEQIINQISTTADELSEPTEQIKRDIANLIFPTVANAMEKFSKTVKEIAEVHEEIKDAFSILKAGKDLSDKQKKDLKTSFQEAHSALKKLIGDEGE